MASIVGGHDDESNYLHRDTHNLDIASVQRICNKEEKDGILKGSFELPPPPFVRPHF